VTTFTITTGYDTFAAWPAPTANYAQSTQVDVGYYVVATQPFYGFVYLPLPPDIIGTTIASATLTGHARSAWAATTTLQAAAVTSGWSDSTLTYNRMPSTGSTSPTVATGTLAAGAPVDFNITTLVQAVASGGAWYGVRLARTAGGIGGVFNSFDSGLSSWTLTIETTEAPEVPQSLVPNGTTVASGAPVLTCDFSDNGGLSNDMAQMNVQVNTSNSFTTPAYDQTGNTTVPVFDLASPPSPATAFTPIPSGSTRYWRVRVKDTDGNWSGWSDGASFTYFSQPAITVLTPAAGVLWDPTSDVIASTSANLSAYRVQITDATDRTAIRYDSGRLPANPAALTTVAVSLPQKYEGQRVLVDDRNYQLHVRVWDTHTDRQSTPGSPAYVDSWSTFHFDDDLTQTPIATLVTDQADVSPAVTLTWTRASAPDGWLVLRDSRVIARLDPADVISGVSTYTWVDAYPQPWVEHVYDVRALTTVSGTSKRSKAGPTASIVPNGRGVWLFTQDGQKVAIDDTDVTQVTVGSRLATYKPVNVRYDVDIVSGFEGLSGPLTGIVPSGLDDTVTLADAVAVLQSIKENPSQSVQLVYGSFSGEVLLRNVSITPDPRGNQGTPLARVSFVINQVGDFDQVL
jgi:hypothetical protein